MAEEAQVIEDQGVVFETNCRVDRPAELLQEYDAVLMAIGTHQGVRLPIPGSQLPGVLLNIDFLRQASLGQETGMGKRVVVLGGGSVAFDCARTAVRLGAEEVHLACLEAREVMTADEEEIVQGQEEGVHVHPAQTFERITGEGHVTGVDFMNVRSFTFDENRRAIIEKEEGSEHHIEADTVIFATGQRAEIGEEAGLTLGRANSIAVGERSLATSVPGIFAAGDAVYGTKSVLQAIACGREAAAESSGAYKTSHFAIMTGISILGLCLIGMISGRVQELLGFAGFFRYVMLCTIPGFLVTIPVSRRIPRDFGKKR